VRMPGRFGGADSTYCVQKQGCPLLAGLVATKLDS
jgi:hypothetical protein